MSEKEDHRRPPHCRSRVPRMCLQTNTKPIRCIKIAVGLVLLLGFWQISLYPATFRAYRKALAQKYSPTHYTDELAEQERLVSDGDNWKWKSEPSQTQRGSYLRADLWAHRSEWEALGHGFEGRTYKYGDVVIKTYRSENAPFRNCVPGFGDDLRWPTELSAQVALGGLADSNMIPENATFLPTIDYFLGPGSTPGSPDWHLVTPLLPAGNLEHLARQLRASDKAYTGRAVDILFRQSLEGILAGLDELHATHNLCHDDIKLDNIMLTTPAADTSHDPQDPEAKSHWLLGDLGNVREVEHSYHRSILWSELNNNLPDCRQNDVLRLLKTYIVFLRGAVTDTDAFDAEFLAGQQHWSRLFWETWASLDEGRNASAAVIRLASQTQHPADSVVTPVAPPRASYMRRMSGGAGAGGDLASLLGGRKSMRARAVKEILRVSASEKTARKWTLWRVTGIPVTSCSAAGADDGGWEEESLAVGQLLTR